VVKDWENFSGEPLTPEENKKARKIIQDQERMTWLWATLRVWSAYLAGALAAIYAAWDHILTVTKALLGMGR
jgi:hypothetical protein